MYGVRTLAMVPSLFDSLVETSTMIPAPRRPRFRIERSIATPSAVLLAAACLAQPASATEHADAGSDMQAMKHPASTAMDHGDAADGAPVMDHDGMDHDGMDHGAATRDAKDAEGAATMNGMDHGEHADVRAGASAGADAPAAFARTSADGLYRVELRNLPEPVPLNRMHEWVVHVEAADGTPVTGASIAMDGGMPIHDHGLPTAPRVTAELGNGDYRLEGVRFQMPGHWVVELAIDAAPGVDSVAFDLNL